MISRRAVLPLLAGIPFVRGAPQNTRPASPADPKETRLLLGGDVMLTRFVGRLAREKQDPAWPLRPLAPYLAAADLTFVNLESPFSEHGSPTEKGMIFRAAPDMIAGLELAGIDVVSTANNHVRDADAAGIDFTLGWLESHGIAAVGTGKTAEEAHAGVVLTRNGIRFGFLAYTYDQSNGNHTDVDDRVCMIDTARMRQDLAALLSRADVAVVSMHAGWEYMPKPNAQQIEFARAAIDAGASVVAGHHPHVVQPWERRGAGVIYYSLGNLVFDQFQRVETQHGILGEVVFSGNKLIRAGSIPVDLVVTAPRLGSVKSASAASSSAKPVPAKSAKSSPGESPAGGVTAPSAKPPAQ